MATAIVKVKLGPRFRMAGPAGNHAPGSVVRMDENNARALVDAGFASYVEGPVLEVATAPTVETAVAPKAKPRRRRKPKLKVAG
jgi:hypothetical protein